MTCHDMEDRLHDYIDGLGSDEERHVVEAHLEGCAPCREEIRRIHCLLDRVKTLPVHMAPAHDLWPAIDARLETPPAQGEPVEPSSAENNGVPTGQIEFPRRQETHKTRGTWLVAGAVAAAVLLVILSIRMMTSSPETGWALIPLEGAPRVSGVPVEGAGAMRIGDWVETDDSSRVKISVGSVGYVDIEPNTRVRLVEAQETEHRLSLDRGTLRAMIWAPPRLFFVETPSAVAIDLGCAYTITVDEQDHGLLHVTAGWVELDHHGRKSTVPAGMLCETRPGIGPGTPFSEEASAPLRQALARFDFEQGGRGALAAVLAEARGRDAVTLRHLLVRVDQEDRGIVYDRMATLMPMPEGVTREGVLRLDALTLERLAGAEMLLEGERQ